MKDHSTSPEVKDHATPPEVKDHATSPEDQGEKHVIVMKMKMIVVVVMMMIMTLTVMMLVMMVIMVMMTQSTRQLTISQTQFQGTSDALSCHIHLPLYFETWTLTAELQTRIQAMEMRCYRKILHILYKDHVMNKEVCAKIQQAIGPHEDLLTIVKRCKLQ